MTASYIFKRIKEPSTLAGLGVIVSLFGVPPGTVEVLVQAVGGLCAALAIILPEGSKE